MPAKDPAKRFQSVSELDVALERAVKARAVPDWRVSIERELCKADMRVRRSLRDGVEAVSAFMKRQDWRALTKIRTEPATAVIVSVILGGAISVALYGRGKSNSTALSPRRFRHLSGLCTVKYAGSRPGLRAWPICGTLCNRVITSHDVDRRRIPPLNW